MAAWTSCHHRPSRGGRWDAWFGARSNRALLARVPERALVKLLHHLRRDSHMQVRGVPVVSDLARGMPMRKSNLPRAHSDDMRALSFSFSLSLSLSRAGGGERRARRFECEDPRTKLFLLEQRDSGVPVSRLKKSFTEKGDCDSGRVILRPNHSIELHFVTDSELRYVSSFRFGRSRVPTHLSTCRVALQNTLHRTSLPRNQSQPAPKRRT